MATEKLTDNCCLTNCFMEIYIKKSNNTNGSESAVLYFYKIRNWYTFRSPAAFQWLNNTNKTQIPCIFLISSSHFILYDCSFYYFIQFKVVKTYITIKSFLVMEKYLKIKFFVSTLKFNFS